MSQAGRTPRLLASVVGLFPESHRSFTEASILGRAQENGDLQIEEVQLRDFATDKHRKVDDTPCGGGPGMILKPDVLGRALDDVTERHGRPEVGKSRRVLLFDPSGRRFCHADAIRLAHFDHLVLVCGRYEGVDARILSRVDEVLSIGDFVLTGGELAAVVVLDAVARQLPGVLGNRESAGDESFADGLLEHRQYTRPVSWEEQSVPPVLLGGDHKQIARARRKDSLLRTASSRPDLFDEAVLDKSDEKLLEDDSVPTLDPVNVPAPATPDAGTP